MAYANISTSTIPERIRDGFMDLPALFSIERSLPDIIPPFLVNLRMWSNKIRRNYLFLPNKEQMPGSTGI
jgi:hypothetical protein